MCAFVLHRSMTTTTTNSLRQFSLKLLLHSSKSPTVARMEMKLGTHTCNIISMTTTLFEQQQIASGNFLKKLLLHFSNSLKVAHMEIKLGTHAHYHDNYMFLTTTYCSNSFRHSSLLKLANGSTHGDETWYEFV